MKFPIYLDHHATTPLDPRVLEAMMPALTSEFANPASHHPFGMKAAKLAEQARQEVAALIHAEDAQEILFTSGATESNNLAIKGVAGIYQEKGRHLITTAIEHKAVLEPCRALERAGYSVTYLPVTSSGHIQLRDLEQAITDKTILISVMAVNNEIGSIQDLAAIGKIAKAKGILFHTDAAQAAGKIPLDVQAMGIDLLSFSAHKMYGPKGVGALYIRRKNPRVRVSPQMHGGGHENGLRSGTLNVAGLAGFGAACAIARKEMKQEAARVLALRERLRKGLWEGLEDIYLNGSLENRLPHNLNVSFAYVEGESLLMSMNEEIAVSSGSACASATPEPSYVMKAIGVPQELIHTAIRFGLGRFNTEEEVDYTVKRFVDTVKNLRATSPIYALKGGI